MMLRVFNYNTLEKVKTFSFVHGDRVLFKMLQLLKNSLKSGVLCTAYNIYALGYIMYVYKHGSEVR